MAKFCTNCGAALDDNKKFCTECGASMADAPVKEEPAPAAVGASAAPKAEPRYSPPVYQAPAQPQSPYTSDDIPPAAGSKYEPITTGGYLGIMLLMCIPIVGQILMAVWAFGGCKKINKRNLARASLIMMAIMLVISLVLGAALRSLFGKVADAIEQETGINISGDAESQSGDDKNQNNAQNEGEKTGLLGSLISLIGGKDVEDTNTDIEALEELEGILGALGGNNGELGEAIGDIKDINAEAEAKNDGWPKSLRKYPGGTATAVASYRTEISGTTAEEMMGWIEDLKSDGFEYQDFYELGMTEADMLSVNGWWATDGEIYISLSFSEGTVTVDHMKELPDMSSLFGD